MNPGVVVPFVVVGIAVLVVGLSSRLGGWSLLAEAYPAADPVEGRKRWFASLGLRRWAFLPTNYGSVVILTFSPGGLGVSLVFPMRFMHPPLFIPWREFARTEASTVLFMKQRSFWFGQTGVRMDVTARLGAEILDAMREAGARPVESVAKT